MTKIYSFAKIFALILITALPNFIGAQTYCSPTYPSGCTSWRITQVTIPLAGFDNSFAAGTCTSARDRTAVIVNLNTMTNYTINVSTTNWIACGMAIDFNHDGDFDDAGEALFLPIYIAVQNQTYSGNFTIPATVANGNYRMRVWNRLANSGAGTPTADSACGTYGYGTWTDYTVAIAQLATSEVSKSNVKAYPNPVSDVLTIENKEAINKIEIYDYNGRMIKAFSASENKVSVKLSALSAGNYTAKVSTKSSDEVIKFIKK